MSRLFITEYKTEQGTFGGPSIRALTFREAEKIASRLVASGAAVDSQNTIPVKVIGYVDGEPTETLAVDQYLDYYKTTRRIEDFTSYVNKLLGLKPAVPRCLDCKAALPPDVYHLCGGCETRRQEAG